MIFKSEIGLVNSNSIVPVRLSSAIERIVIAGIRKRKNHGERLKNGIRSASNPSKRFVSIEIIQWNAPDKIKKIRIKMYPIMEPKKLLISFKYSALMCAKQLYKISIGPKIRFPFNTSTERVRSVTIIYQDVVVY